MASGTRKITVEFLGNDKSLGRIAGEVDGKMSRLGGKLKTVGKVAALGLAAGTVIAGKALWDMGKAAAEDAQQQAILSKALKNSAGATDKQVAATEDWITAQGKAFGVADDKLRPALATLARATGDVGKAQKLASLAMDISAATGKDLTAVSLALAKGQNGQTAGLGKLGVNMKDATGHAVSFAEAQKRLNDKFGGSAQTNAQTFSGKMARLRLMFDETKESIGAKLLPVAEKLANWFISSGLPAIQKFSAEMKAKLQPVFAWLGEKVPPILGQLAATFRTNFESIKSIIGTFVAIAKVFWDKFGGVITQTVTTALANIKRVIGGQLQIITGIFKTIAALLKGDWSGVWDGLKQIVTGALNVIRGIVGLALNGIRAAFQVQFVIIKTQLGLVWSGIKTVISNGANAVVNTVKGIPGRLLALGKLFLSAGKGLIGKFLDGLGATAGFAADFANQIWNAVKNAINGGIDQLNGLLEFDLKVKGVGIHVNAPDVPHLAKGGVVKARRGGTLALIGEAGHDEAVIPLSGPNAPRMASAGGSAGGDFAATAPLILQLDSTKVWQGLVKMKRTNGIVSRGLA